MTDIDGRVRDWLPDGVPAGLYRLVFETGVWFARSGRATLYPRVHIDCDLEGDQPHYHVALLLAPFGFSTYRGT
jgi:5-hydroxyisourate hydrolase